MAKSNLDIEKPTNYTINPEDVIAKEKAHLKLKVDDPASGIAISGGGIRSASFGLGVLQALVSNNQLSKMDYMSTVSGGGYLGSALTWALSQDKEKAGTTPETFPLGKRGSQGGKNDANESNENKSMYEDENQLLDFIRQHGSYLTPTNSLGIISFVAIIIRGTIMSLFVYFSILAVAMTSSLWCVYKIFNLINPQTSWKLFEDVNKTNAGLLLLVGTFILSFIILRGFGYSLSTFLSSKKASNLRYKRFIQGQQSIGLLLKICLPCFVLGSLPYTVMLINNLPGYIGPYLAASGSTLFGAAVGFWQYIKARSNEKNKTKSSNLLVYFGAFALFYGVLLFAYLCATRYFLDDQFNLIQPLWFLILIATSIIFGYFVNLNFIGPHHIWRNRLMEAFMPNKSAVKTNSWEPSTEADAALMEDMCAEANPRPYHIINTNVILNNSLKVDFSGRGGDNFIISPLYCGSDATGWKTTKTFQKNKTRGITLASAMATSAAALNPNAGVSGEGVTRNVVISILLSMLNLRLGYWTCNPATENTLGSPNFFHPGLLYEILRFGFTESNKNLLLSDGGHYENLAIYELIRRKLKLVVVSDGGADVCFNFDDLANAIEKVRVDFGTKISFKQGYKPDDILPGTAGESFFQKKYDLAKHGYAFADIRYNDGSTGTLVYVKLAMIEGLSTDVYSYKGIHPTFPHQSTSDQFFDEKQFEAYRELGYYLGWQMMNSPEGQKIFD